MDQLAATLSAVVRRTTSGYLARHGGQWSVFTPVATGEREDLRTETPTHEVTLDLPVATDMLHASAPTLDALLATLHSEEQVRVAVEDAMAAADPGTPEVRVSVTPKRPVTFEAGPLEPEPVTENLLVTFVHEEQDRLVHVRADVRDMKLAQRSEDGSWYVDLGDWLDRCTAAVGASARNVNVIRGIHVLDGDRAAELERRIGLGTEGDDPRLRSESGRRQAGQEAVNAHFRSLGRPLRQGSPLMPELWQHSGLLVDERGALVERVIGLAPRQPLVQQFTELFSLVEEKSQGRAGLALVSVPGADGTEFGVWLTDAAGQRKEPASGIDDVVSVSLTFARRFLSAKYFKQRPLIWPSAPERGANGAWPDHAAEASPFPARAAVTKMAVIPHRPPGGGPQPGDGRGLRR